MKALVIGGTGPTGQYVIEGLESRGYEVVLLHRGVHEADEVAHLEHIHVDPHFQDSLNSGIGSRRFDLVVGMYGRTKAIAEVFRDKCDQLVVIGGIPVYQGLVDRSVASPTGMAILAREDGALVDALPSPPKFPALMREAEKAVLHHAESGAYMAAGVRYPQIYGPRTVIPWEWSVVRRVRDGRRTMIVPDDGLWIVSRCAARNAAEVVLLCVDNPMVANGQFYNCADDDQYTIRQWAELVAAFAGGELELIGIPSSLAPSAFQEFLPPGGSPHALVDITKARKELGYQQVVDSKCALTATVQWLLENPVEMEDSDVYPVRFDYDAEDKLIDAYQRAHAWVRDTVPDEARHASHPMPHPKKPSLTADEKGR